MHSEARPLSEQTVALPLNFMFPQAHAGFWDGVMSVVSFILPIQELGIVLQQLTYAVTDPDKFEGDTFIVNLIVAATYLPPGRVLQPFAKTLGVLFKTLKGVNPKFLKYFGGMFSGIMSKAKKGDFDTLWNMLPFFIVMAEMYNDEEARKGLEFMFKTVDSGEDILSWVDYLALPAEGWVGDGVPEVGMLFEPAQPELPLSWMMNQAYAQGKLKRISGVTLGKNLFQAMSRISKEQITHLPDAAKIITQTLKSADAAALRKYVFSPSMFIGSTAVMARRGGNALKAFLKGKTNARYSPVIVLATVAYLEWEIGCGKVLDGESSEDDAGGTECNNKGITGEKNRNEIRKLYAKVFVDSLNSKFEEEPDDDEGLLFSIRPYGHGALFHLNQIAQHQILHRAGGPEIKEIEGSRLVWVYKNKEDKRELGNPQSPAAQTSAAKKAGAFVYNRKVDIVIGNPGQPEQWIELKSYSAYSHTGEGRKKLVTLGGQPIGQWAGGKGANIGKANLHKQYTLDRIAATEGQVRWLNPERNVHEIIKVNPDYKWYFQTFKVSPPKSTREEVHPILGSESDKGSILYSMAQPIKADKDLVDANIGSAAANTSKHVQYASLKKLISGLTALGFKEAADALVDALEE